MHKLDRHGTIKISKYSQSLLTYTDTEGAIGGRINGVSILSGLNLEKMTGLSFPGDKANSPKQRGVRIKRVCVKRGLRVITLSFDPK